MPIFTLTRVVEVVQTTEILASSAADALAKYKTGTVDMWENVRDTDGDTELIRIERFERSDEGLELVESFEVFDDETLGQAEGEDDE